MWMTTHDKNSVSPSQFFEIAISHHKIPKSAKGTFLMVGCYFVSFLSKVTTKTPLLKFFFDYFAITNS
jgi:hypothetical protein